MEKTRDLFKKIGNTKGKFHARMSKTKDRNGMVKTEEEEIIEHKEESKLSCISVL